MKYSKLLNLFNSTEKKGLIFLFSFMSLNTLLEIFGLSLIIPIIGLTMGSDTSYTVLIYLKNLLNLKPDEIFIYLVSFFVIFQTLKLLFVIWYNWYENNYLYSFKERISSKILQTYLSQNFSFFFSRNSSKLLRNMTYSVDMCSLFLFQFLKISLDTIMLVSIFIFLAFYNFQVTLFIIVALLFLSSIYIFSLKDKLRYYGIQRQHHANKRLQFFQESIENIKYIKITGKEKFFFDKFRSHNLEISNTSIPAEFLKSLPKPLLEIFAVIIIMFLLIYFTKSQDSSTILVFETLGLYLAAAFRLMPSFSRILSGYQSLKNSYPELENLTEEFKKEKKITLNNFSNFKFQKNISVNINNFFYDKEKQFLLKSANFQINKGNKIGIIGESGSGKSTIIDLITGVIEPLDGYIKVDGKSIHSDLRGWQNIIGYVPQKITIIEDTLENNILFGKKSDQQLNKKVLDLIKKTNLTNLMNSSSNNLSSLISEKGKNISGGEMQRIAICRAVLNDPEVLILDEATSSLDTNTEDQILDMIKNLYDKTVIFVSHKTSTLKYCNKIYKVINGKLENFSIKN